MDNDGPELSSIASVLGELTERVTALADRAARTKDDELAYDLYEVERSLRGANRRMSKIVRRASPRA